MNLNSKLIHGGVDGDKTTGAVNVPVYLTSTSKMQYPNSVWWISQDLLTEMFIHRIFTNQYQSLKNIHFIVYPINCYIFANEKSCLTSKHMHIAEFSTIAKSLPQLRWNTHKSLILSYSEYLGRISDKIFASYSSNNQHNT